MFQIARRQRNTSERERLRSSGMKIERATARNGFRVKNDNCARRDAKWRGSMRIEFTATIQIRGVNPFVLVSTRRAKAIKPGWRKPLPVAVRLNGKPSRAWRINMMPVGNGSFYLYLHSAIRKASGAKAGDRVRVEIEFNSAYRGGPQHPMPRRFKEAIETRTQAGQNWAALIPSRKKEILRYFAGLKSEEARERNLLRALHVLSGKPGRFMGREWRNGS